MTETTTAPDQAQTATQAIAMAELMDDDQKANIVALLLLHKAVEVLMAGNPTVGIFTIRSPFNADHPVSLYGGVTQVEDAQRFAAIIFDGAGDAETPKPDILAVLYQHEERGLSCIAPLDNPVEPEHVSRVRKVVFAAILSAREAAQTTEVSEVPA